MNTDDGSASMLEEVRYFLIGQLERDDVTEHDLAFLVQVFTLWFCSDDDQFVLAYLVDALHARFMVEMRTNREEDVE